MSDHAAISDRAVEHGTRWRPDKSPEFGVDAVRGDDDVGFDNSAIRKRHPGYIAVLRKAGGTVSGMHNSGRQGSGEEFNEVGAVHAECRVPTG